MKTNRILGLVITLAVIGGFSTDTFAQGARQGRLRLEYALGPSAVTTGTQSVLVLSVRNVDSRFQNTLQPGDSIMLVIPIGDGPGGLVSTGNDLSCLTTPDDNAWQCEIVDKGIKVSVVGNGFDVGQAGTKNDTFAFSFACKVNPQVGMCYLGVEQSIDRRRARMLRRRSAPSFRVMKVAASQQTVTQTTAQVAILRWYQANTTGNSFSVGSNPDGICFDGASIWVANFGSNDVTKLRASDGANLGTFSVGVSPNGICFDGANIWTANQGSNTVTKLRARDGVNLGNFPAGGPAEAICFDGENVWVATETSSPNIVKIRARDGANLGSFDAGSNFPKALCFDGENVWVANWGSNIVRKLRASNGENLGTFAVGIDPYGICFDGENIWVANFGSDNVTKLRASGGASLGTFAVEGGPRGICFDGANIWVVNVNSNSVTKLRASDGANLGTFATGNGPQRICFDGANVWGCNWSDNDVTKL